VHRIAFASPGVQLAAADMEDGMFRRDLDGVAAGPPVFVTSLPRAGTTILLTALASAPEFATHLYRDMPFVMAPLLWSRLSGRFRKKATLSERAHGDGIAIGYDSPEAFEEVIWRAFWPEHFAEDGIALGKAGDAKEEGRAFLETHFRKIVALRHGGKGPVRGRYLSKNNGNVARIDLIRAMFPDAAILVPVRCPLAHAASLHRQHANFLARHAEDPFTLRYMGDIGHYEFGALHRPIRFPGFAALAEGLGPTDFDYWLAYWIAAFEHVAERREAITLLGYEDIAGRPDAGTHLAGLLGLDPAYADAIGGHFRPAPPLSPELDAHRGPLRDRAETLHAELLG
jgi:hypothetical protein